MPHSLIIDMNLPASHLLIVSNTLFLGIQLSQTSLDSLNAAVDDAITVTFFSAPPVDADCVTLRCKEYTLKCRQDSSMLIYLKEFMLDIGFVMPAQQIHIPFYGETMACVVASVYSKASQSDALDSVHKVARHTKFMLEQSVPSIYNNDSNDDQ